jgi:hypothetical protein
VKKKELKDLERLEELVTGAVKELRADWLKLTASCQNDDEVRSWEKLLFPKPLTIQQMYDFCAAIKENLCCGKADNVFINLAARRQAFHGNEYPVIGDAGVKFKRAGADSPVEFILPEGEQRDMLIFLGNDQTGINRGFVLSKEEGEDFLCELESFRMYSIADYSARLDQYGRKVVYNAPDKPEERGIEVTFSECSYRNIDAHFPDATMKMSLEEQKRRIADAAERIASGASGTVAAATASVGTKSQ